MFLFYFISPLLGGYCSCLRSRYLNNPIPLPSPIPIKPYMRSPLATRNAYALVLQLKIQPPDKNQHLLFTERFTLSAQNFGVASRPRGQSLFESWNPPVHRLLLVFDNFRNENYMANLSVSCSIGISLFCFSRGGGVSWPVLISLASACKSWHSNATLLSSGTNVVWSWAGNAIEWR